MIRRWWPFVLFLLTPLLVFPREMFRAGMMDGGDDKLSNLPLLLHSARRFLAGDFLWTSDLMMGTPLLGEPEAATLYLPRLLLLLGSPAVAYALYICAHFVMAQCTAYLYLRELGLERGAAAFGAIAYGYAGFMVGHIGHTMYVVAGAWAPLFLYFLHRLLEARGRASLNAVLAALSFACCLFGGAVQLSVYLLSLAAILHLSLAVITRRLRPLVIFAVVAVASVAIAAMQILPSLDYSAALNSTQRHEYAFATQLSWNPLLLPTLFLAVPPLGGAEVYSRIGVVVSLSAIAAVVAMRSKPIVRAWAIVAAVALLLMLGRHVPPIAYALHRLPLVSVLRGPVRHNFELGFAVAVLAAFGVQTFVPAAPRTRRIAVATVFLVAIVAAIFHACRRGFFNFPEATIYRALPREDVVRIAAIALSAVIAWFALRRLARGRYAAWIPAALIALALIETRASEETSAKTLWSDLGRPGVPTSFADEVRPDTRVLPPRIDTASFAALPANTNLYLPGVQSLTGYVSIAPDDLARVLDLDMHGHPRHYVDLVWSRLPSIFGVTHVMLPLVTCATEPFALDATSATCVRDGGKPFALTDERRCTTSFGDGRRRYRVDAELRALGVPGSPLILGMWGPGTSPMSAPVSIAPSQLTAQYLPFGGNVDLSRFPVQGWLAAYTEGKAATDVRALRLSSMTLAPVVSFVRPAPTVDVRVGEALSGSLRLEVVAARRSGTPRLVVDLYDGPSFDPEEAQLVLDQQLGDRAMLFARDFTVANAPRSTRLRVFLEGDGTVDIRAVRLLAEHRENVAAMRAGEVLRGAHYKVDGDVVQLDSVGSAMMKVHLPVRPITVDAILAEHHGGAVGIGLAHGDVPDAPDMNELTTSTHLRRTVHLPASASDATLRIYPTGSAAIAVREVSAHSACADARYVPVRELEGGLWLYRNEGALPRVFTVNNVVRMGSLEAARDTLRGDPSFDPTSTAIVDTGELPHDLRKGTIEAPRFDGSRFEALVTVAGGPTFVVLNDRFDAHFRATVDGVETKLYRTNALVRGLLVPPGSHRVVVTYVAPRALWLGVASALFGLLFAALVVPRVASRLAA